MKQRPAYWVERMRKLESYDNVSFQAWNNEGMDNKDLPETFCDVETIPADGVVDGMFCCLVDAIKGRCKAVCATKEEEMTNRLEWFAEITSQLHIALFEDEDEDE